MHALRRWILIGALALIGGGALASAFVWWPQRMDAPSVATPASVPVPTVALTRSWLDGAPLAAGAVQPLAVAIIIDNAPESQPQSGFAAAPLVFEVPVEGRRTRLLTIVPLDGGSQPIGPVRSARPYFVGLAQFIGAPLVHVGGSPAALDALRSGGWLHINQYFDPPFWRDVSRRAPFNVYTAASNLGALIRTREWEERLRESVGALWQFTDDLPLSHFAPTSPRLRWASKAPRDKSLPLQGEGEKRSGGGDVINLAYDAGPYVVEWTYDAQAGVYKRSQDGRSHLVRSGSEERVVTAANVVVLRVRSRVLDAIGRLEIPALEPPVQLSSTPMAATVYSGGQRVDGTWDWNIGGAPRFQLLRADGTPITLRPGTTWVEVVDFDW